MYGSLRKRFCCGVMLLALLLPMSGFAAVCPDGSGSDQDIDQIDNMLIAGESKRCFGGYNERTGSIKLEGATVEYEIQGRGIPCIVFASSKMYPRVLSWRLRRHFEFIFLDARWFGQTTDAPINSSFSLDDIANDIETVKNALGYDKVAVMGHSVHGNIVMEYARRYPESVSHVIVLGGSPVGLIELSQVAPVFWNEQASAERQAQMAENMEILAGMDLSALPPHEQFITQYIYEAPKYWADYTYDCSWIWEDVTFTLPMVNLVYSLFYFFDLTGIDVPIFAAHGMMDFSIPYTLWEAKEGTMENLTVEIFDNSGHYPMFEESCKFDARLLGWIYTH